VIEQALDTLNKREQLEQAQRAVADFPQEISRLIGDEWQRLTSLKGELEKQRSNLTTATTARDRADEAIRATGLPEEGVPAELVGTLHNRCDTLREHARERNRLESERNGTKTALNKALSDLGPDASSERAAELDAATLDELFKFVQQVDKYRQEGEASERLTKWLNVVREETTNPDTVREGIVLLERWLAEQRITPPTVTGKER